MDKPADLEYATRFLREKYGARTSAVEAIGRGDWSRAFGFRLDGRDLVVRFGHHLDDFLADRQAVDFAGPDLPVPAVLDVGETDDRYYAVSERRFGTFLEELDEPGWRRILAPLLRGLDHLRLLDAPGVGVSLARDAANGQSMSWRGWLGASVEDRAGERVSEWRARLADTPAIESVFLAGERALLAQIRHCPEVRHIVHRDLLNRNVLVSPDGSRLEAVFDWGCSVAGDFLYEVAWFTFWAPWYPALAALSFREVVRQHYRDIGLQVEGFDERLNCYELQIGLEHIAYGTFTAHYENVRWIADRTQQVLGSMPA